MASLIACIDGSPYSESVCDHSAWLSRRLDAPITLLHIHHPSRRTLPAVANAPPLAPAWTLEPEATKALFEASQQRLLQRGLATPVKTLTHTQGLIESLKTLESDIRALLLGKRGERSGNSGVGSQLEAAIRAIRRPILICPRTFKPPRRFTIAYDGRDATHQGVLALARGSLLTGMQGTLLRVGTEQPQHRRQLDDLALLLRSAGCQTEVSFAHGDVERMVPRHLEERRTDLLIMGAYGHSGLWHFLRGSRTSQLLHSIDLPLLLLR